MKRMMIYENGKVYFDAGGVSIFPSIPPLEEYDLTNLTDEEIKALKENPNDEIIRSKITKINNG